MGKLVVTEYVSIDGVFEDPGGSENAGHGGWTFAYFDQDMLKFKFDELMAADVQLLGRVTYDGFAAAWPNFKDEQGFADKMNNMPKVVVSSTLKDAAWNNTRIVSSNVTDEVNRLRQAPGGDIIVAGSATLVRYLAANDLVDEYRFLVHPIVLGSGKRIFDDSSPMQGMKLEEARSFGSGIVALIYTRDNKA
jgi:dihydrofolate reductase